MKFKQFFSRVESEHEFDDLNQRSDLVKSPDT